MKVDVVLYHHVPSGGKEKDRIKMFAPTVRDTRFRTPLARTIFSLGMREEPCFSPAGFRFDDDLTFRNVVLCSTSMVFLEIGAENLDIDAASFGITKRSKAGCVQPWLRCRPSASLIAAPNASPSARCNLVNNVNQLFYLESLAIHSSIDRLLVNAWIFPREANVFAPPTSQLKTILHIH
jgi:hypothetical protein